MVTGFYRAEPCGKTSYFGGPSDFGGCAGLCAFELFARRVGFPRGSFSLLFLNVLVVEAIRILARATTVLLFDWMPGFGLLGSGVKLQ